MFTPAVKRSVVFAAVTFVFGATAFADELVAFATGGYASGLRTPEMMHKIDADGDGKVSKAEWQAYHEKLFAMLDADHSGALETQEFMHPKQDVASFATGGFASALSTQDMLVKLDTDQDGKVSRAEFLVYQSKVFEMMDTTTSRSLDQNEFFGRGPTNR
jgi:hypothetical protein